MKLSREHCYYKEFWEWFDPHFSSPKRGCDFLARLFPEWTADAIRNLRQRITSSYTAVDRRPPAWTWAWPMPSYPGNPSIPELAALFHEIESVQRYWLSDDVRNGRAAKILASVDGVQPAAPSDFRKPDGYKTGNIITDATGDRLGDEIASAFLEPKFDNKEVPRDLDGLLTGFERAQREKKMHDQSQRKARIDFRHLNVPILIMQHTDVHWGSEDTDYSAIRRHLQLLKEVPYMYSFGTGDFQEFAKLKHRGAVEGQIHSPTVQARAVRAALVETWDKWLAIVLGNHDMRIFLESGFDVGEYLVGEVPKGKKRIPFLRDGGLVVIEHGSQVYTHNIFHGDSSFGTRFNENHKGRQTARMVDGRCDATWNGHTHNPAVQDTNEPSDDMGGARDACYLQGGSYKVLGDDHAVRRKYLMVDDVQMPAVIQFPDVHRVMPFKRVEDAVFIHRQLVNAYEAGNTLSEVWGEI